MTLEQLLQQVLSTEQPGFDPLDLKNYGPPIPLSPKAYEEQVRHMLVVNEIYAQEKELHAEIEQLSRRMNIECQRWMNTIHSLQPDIPDSARISDDLKSYHVRLPDPSLDKNKH